MSSDDRRHSQAPAPLPRTEVVAETEEPPVVARLVVEIRSDGSRTIARGAMENGLSGESVAIQAEGTSPLALALSLARSIFAAPVLARTLGRAPLMARAAAQALLPGQRKNNR